MYMCRVCHCASLEENDFISSDVCECRCKEADLAIANCFSVQQADCCCCVYDNAVQQQQLLGPSCLVSLLKLLPLIATDCVCQLPGLH